VNTIYKISSVKYLIHFNDIITLFSINYSKTKLAKITIKI